MYIAKPIIDTKLSGRIKSLKVNLKFGPGQFAISLAILSFFSIYCPIYGQSIVSCKSRFDAAEVLAEKKDYRGAFNLYSNAFANSPECTTDEYLVKGAKIALRAGLTDFTIKLLAKIIERKARHHYISILADEAFDKLRHDERWLLIKKQLEVYIPVVEDELIELKFERNKADLKLALLGTKFGANSKRYIAFRDTIGKLDNDNTFKVESIIRTYDWLGEDQIEKEGIQALLYLFQKLSFREQKGYYPFLASGFRHGKLDGINFATMADIIALRDQGKQIYGTQKKLDRSFFPIENPDSVNFRRITVGLPPIAM